MTVQEARQNTNKIQSNGILKDGFVEYVNNYQNIQITEQVQYKE